MRMGEYEEVIDECTAALEIEPENVKALFRRGQAQLAIGELRLARSDLVAAARAAPKNKEAKDAPRPFRTCHCFRTHATHSSYI